jgi:hypothetical protein
MSIHIPVEPKQRKGFTLAQVAGRWRVKTAEARYLLEQAGIKIVLIETPPVAGVLTRDLLELEKKMRTNVSITWASSSSVSLLTLITNLYLRNASGFAQEKHSLSALPHFPQIPEPPCFMTDPKFELTPRQAWRLIQDVASMCERAYRRGAQQGVVLKLSEPDAAWYRYFDPKNRRNYFSRSHRLPQPALTWKETGKPVDPRQYSQRHSWPATKLLDQELNEYHETLTELTRFVENHGFDLGTGKRKPKSNAAPVTASPEPSGLPGEYEINELD